MLTIEPYDKNKVTNYCCVSAGLYDLEHNLSKYDLDGKVNVCEAYESGLNNHIRFSIQNDFYELVGNNRDYVLWKELDSGNVEVKTGL